MIQLVLDGLLQVIEFMGMTLSSPRYILSLGDGWVASKPHLSSSRFLNCFWTELEIQSASIQHLLGKEGHETCCLVSVSFNFTLPSHLTLLSYRVCNANHVMHRPRTTKIARREILLLLVLNPTNCVQNEGLSAMISALFLVAWASLTFAALNVDLDSPGM